MANEVIGIDVQVSLEQLRAQLATLGPGMDKEAKAMTAALAKEIKKQTAALKAGTKNGLSGFGAQAGAAATKFDKLAKAAGPLGGVLARISPEAGAAASGLAELTGAAEAVAAGLGVSLGGVAVALGLVTAAVGIGAVAWKAYHREEELVKKATEELASGLKELQPIHTLAASSALDLAHATGKISDSEYGLKKSIESAAGARDKATAAARERVKALQAEAVSVDDMTLGNGTLTAEYVLQQAELRDSLQVIEAADRAYESTVQNLTDTSAALDKKARAEKRAADESKKAAAVEAEAAAATARATERSLAGMKALDDRRALSGQRAKKRADEAAKQAAADAKQSEIDSAAELARIEEEAAARRAALQVNLSTTASVAGSIFSVWDQLNQQKLDGIDTSTRDGKKAAMKQWEENKAAALAMATIQAALAIAMAVAAYPPPFNIPGIITNTVAGAAAVTSIAAAPPPAFAAGGFVNAAATGSPAVLHPNEAVLSAQGRQALGDDTIREANAGRSGGGEMRVVQVYKHKAFDYFVADNLRTDGPLGRSLRRGDRVGQLRRGRA